MTAVNNACLGAVMILTADEAARLGQRFERALLRLVRTPRRARRYANTLAPDAERLIDAASISGRPN
jgi:hypothetical protein